MQLLSTQSRAGRWIGLGMFFIVFDLGALALAFSCLRRGSTNDAVGCFVMAAILLFFTVLAFLPASPARRPEGHPISSPGMLSSGTDDMVEVMQSTDAIVIEIVRGKLVASGISAEIMGEHSSRMMGHLSAIPMRLMVPRGEMDRCSQVLDENVDA